MIEILVVLSIQFLLSSGWLYPQESETRDIKDLSGLWWFVAEPKNSPGYGIQNNWWNVSLSTFDNATKIPVPSSFNELTQSKDLREHVGWVWYQRQVYVSPKWATTRVNLRFGSVNYFASVVSCIILTFITHLLICCDCSG